MDILSIGDQDYISGGPIDFKVVNEYTRRYDDGRDDADVYEGILHCVKGEKEVETGKVTKGWFGEKREKIKIQIPLKWYIEVPNTRIYNLNEENLLDENWSNRKKRINFYYIQLLESRYTSDRTRPIKEEKDRKMAEEKAKQEAEKATQEAARIERQKQKDAADKIYFARVKEEFEKRKAEEKAKQDALNAIQDAKLDEDIENGVKSNYNEYKKNDIIKYNGKKGKIIDKTFLIQYDDGHEEHVMFDDDKLMNITIAEKNKKNVLYDRKYPPKPVQTYDERRNYGGRRTRKRKRNKTRKWC